MDVSVDELQRRICRDYVQTHLAGVDKQSGPEMRMDGMDPVTFTGLYRFIATVPGQDANITYGVSTEYSVDVPRRKLGGRFCQNSQGITAAVRTSRGTVAVTFAPVQGLFALRIKSLNDLLACDKKPPFLKSVQGKYTLTVNSSRAGSVMAYMRLSHPRAEQIIEHFLGAIEETIRSYRHDPSARGSVGEHAAPLETALLKEAESLLRKEKLRVGGG